MYHGDDQLIIMATREGASPAIYAAGQCSKHISIVKITDEAGMLDVSSSGTTLIVAAKMAYVVVSHFRIR